MKKILPLFLFLSFLLTSCAEEDKAAETKYVTCTKALENSGACTRWMDRNIYFAYSSGSSPNRNNEFQKAKVQETFKEIEKLSTLGSGYFIFNEVDEAVLQPIYDSSQSESEYKSFVLIWPDADFNDFVVNTLGGAVPDQNGVAIVNSAYKRKFYIILKASCFTSATSCNSITTAGLSALIARQVGLLVGMPVLADCSSDASNTMCSQYPNNDQWNDFNKLRWSNSFNNALETISNNPNFYDENFPN